MWLASHNRAGLLHSTDVTQKALLDTLSSGQPRDRRLLTIPELRQRVGFDEYYEVFKDRGPYRSGYAISKAEIKAELLLGAVLTTLTGLVPLAASRLKQEYPDLHVRVVPELTRELVRMLERGNIDAAILSGPVPFRKLIVYLLLVRRLV